MKKVNLISIVDANKNLDSTLSKKYFANFLINSDLKELDELTAFVIKLQSESKNINDFENYYLGYTIPQISKEFDILRFGKDYIVNIELKRTNTGEKIRTQLIQNQYYLSFLKKNIFSFTFVSDENKLFSLDENQDLIEISFHKLHKILSNQYTEVIQNINSLFDPSNYLVSPFNSTDSFIANNYFLTDHQNRIKKDITELIDENKVTYISIYGKAGTGKTLLTYDIAKDYLSKNKKVLIMHCGNLNAGQYKLKNEYHWEIIPVKEWKNYKLNQYAFVIIDEVQRIWAPQLRDIVNELNNERGKCIFSYDNMQCLSDFEIKNNIPKIITSEIKSQEFKLTEKIRTNKEIAYFIRALFDKTKSIENQKIENVEIQYFKDYKVAKNYIKNLRENGWKIINYTKQSYNCGQSYEEYNIIGEDNAHGVIGQEFDNVIAIIDNHFYYNEEQLSTRGYVNKPYYNPTKMLFQMVTRTRKKLNLVIIDNVEILDRCLDILGNN